MQAIAGAQLSLVKTWPNLRVTVDGLYGPSCEVVLQAGENANAVWSPSKLLFALRSYW